MAITLPRFYSTKELPGKSGLVPVSPGMAAKPFEALSQAGENVERLGLHAANVFGRINEQERIASDALQALELEINLKKETEKIAESFRDRIDYENFDKDVDNQILSLKERLSPKEPSQALNLAFEKSFNQQAFHLNSTIKAKKYDVMNQRGKIAFGAILDQAYQDYSDTNDPVKREIIKNQLEIQGEILRGKHAIDPLWIDQKLSAFEKDAKKVASDLADVKADKAIMANPGQAYINLQDSKYLPDLLPKQRQDKIEKANAAFKVFQNEQEKKAKEQEVLAHDNEEKEIGNLFLAGNYKDAYVMAFKSKLLKGDEKKSWGIAIEERAKKKEPQEDDPAEYYNMLQDVLKATPEQKIKVGTNIAQSKDLKTETKKALIKELLETKEDEQIFNNPWFKFAEKSIRESLGWTEMMGFFNLKNPQEAQSSYRDIVRQLITEIKKYNLKGEDIDKRARQLALPHQMKVWNMLMGGKSEEKPKEKAKEKYNVGQIYTDAQGKRAKYLGAAKWEMVK